MNEGAWDFEEINHRYEDYVRVGAKASQLQRNAGTEMLALWLRQERAAWLHAVSLDPLLPQALLPPVYLGQKAAAVRQQAMATARTFLAQ